MMTSILFTGQRGRNYLQVLSAARSYSSSVNKSSTNYVEDMYSKWLRDPTSVHISWDAYFRNNYPNASAMAVGQPDEKIIDDHLAVQAIIRSYQSRGHLAAELDPLGITNPESSISKDGV
uniref:2-oxoglutarate dehydrogenase, mitochondrial n=1 Tax=Megaselia scalaris TaxID=36166 RepID=T1H4S0_MEGSC